MTRLLRRPAACLAFALVVSAAASLPASELPPTWRNWSHFREIDIEAVESVDELVSVLLPDDIWIHARTDLADLRLIDQNGSELGYVLFSPGRMQKGAWRRVEVSDRGTVPEHYSQVVVDTGGGGSMHNAMEVTLAPDEDEAFTWVEVAASEDRKTWRVVRSRAPLFRFDERGFRGPVVLRYPQTRDRWLRLRLLDVGEKILVETVRVADRAAEETIYLPIQRRMARRSDAPDGESVWKPHGALPRMPISGVRVATGREEFHRPIVVSVSEDGDSWRNVGRGHVYRHQAIQGDDSGPHQDLEVEVRETAAPYWRVTIMDRGDPPIDDLEVSLLRYRKSLVAKPGEEGTLRLLYGNPLAAVPEYELAELTSDDELAAAREATPGKEQANEAYLSAEPFTERHPIILWIALGLAVVIIGGLALRSLR